MGRGVYVLQHHIEETTNFILRNPSGVKKWLTLADKYMQTFAEAPKDFLLPKAHMILKPLIEVYARNPDGFLQYVLGVRDSFSPEDKAWEDVQVIYRRINGRYVQQQRRERSSRAVTKAIELFGGAPNYHVRLKWVADLEHEWAKRRLAFLEIHRDKLSNNRIDAETRADLLAEFWDIIDTEIYEGGLPDWGTH